MIELLSVKYEKEFKEFVKVRNFSNEQAKVSQWVSSLLIALSQFDKINKEQQTLLQDKGTLEPAGQSLTTSLKIIKQVAQNLDMSAFTGNNLQTGFNKHLALFSDVMDILDNIQSKNFVAACRNTLSIIDSYTLSKAEEKNNPKVFKILDLKYANGEAVIKNFGVNTDSTELYFEVDPKAQVLKIKLGEAAPPVLELDKLQQVFLQRYASSLLFFLNKTGKEKKNNTKEFEAFKENARSRNRKLFDAIEKNECLAKDDNINKIALFLALKNAKNDVDLVAAKEKFSYLVDTTISPISSFASEKKYTVQLLKLSEFFGDVLSSTNSEQLASVIESHAMPPTSYKLKRKMGASIDLNAYVGGFAGYIGPLSKSATIKEGMTGGITAPIGITIKSYRNFFLEQGKFTCSVARTW
ncbi:hypothetical protein KUH03_30805 [Sphingobacterium sp. E70]|uniref:hypothetical protein n=1 Tax=Sphingobacterium sp. E70 TaxID=2853439 RepID=UPI00211CCC1E|nr:hypothetical protein [Sphingobacterium sp. E70]ULT23527.1 hypothetical protein KUH03_30805 [Sphingobacterium sp. E70]